MKVNKNPLLKITFVIILLLGLIYLLNILINKSSMELFTNMNKKKYSLVLYFATWCPHCSVLYKPVGSSLWDQLTVKYKDNDLIEITKKDGDSMNTEEKTKLGIKGYPTIILHKNDEKIEYEGGRTIDEISAFIDKHLNIKD